MAIPKVNNATEAGNAIYQTFGEVAESVQPCHWGKDFLVTSRAFDGKENVRVVMQTGNQKNEGAKMQQFPQRSLITQMREQSDYRLPAVLTALESAPRKKSIIRPEPDEDKEDEILQTLDSLSAQLLALDPEIAIQQVPFDAAIRKSVKARKRERLESIRIEYDELGLQGREQLAELRKLQGKDETLRSDYRDAQKRHFEARNAAAKVTAQRPKDTNFPSRLEVEEWQHNLREARSHVAETAAPEEELRGALRSSSVTIAQAKTNLRELRDQRQALAATLGIAQPPSDAEPDAERLSLQAG